MTFLLLKSLKEFLKKTFEHQTYRVPGDDLTFKSPEIYYHKLLPKRTNEEQKRDFPFLILKAGYGSDSSIESVVYVDITFGAYDETTEFAVQNLLNMVDKVRLAVLEAEMISSQFSIVPDEPLSWRTDDESIDSMTTNHVFATMRLKFNRLAIQQKIKYE